MQRLKNEDELAVSYTVTGCDWPIISCSVLHTFYYSNEKHGRLLTARERSLIALPQGACINAH